ncbi:hypothetical protein, partial [Staphylococcus pseudintermedius]|uniref:hypothetical protein n=1 Tax=Staphylococcus pseudintermedius TaxID=283734 RepID=UPI001A8CEE18
FVYKVFRVHSNSKPVIFNSWIEGYYLSSHVSQVDEIQVLCQQYAKFWLMIRNRADFSNIDYK